MISIGKPYITIEHDTAYLRAPVQISEDAAKVYLEKTAPLKNTAWLTSGSRHRCPGSSQTD